MSRFVISSWPRPAAALLVLMVVALAGGCAPKSAPAPEYQNFGLVWDAFRDNYLQPPDGAKGLLVKSSLYYSSPKRKKGNRTLVDFWGDMESPLRLDVRAGIGTHLVHIREDGQGLLAFYPDRNEAYSHADPVRGAELLGLPFPFSMRDLAYVLTGSFRDLIPRDFDSVRQLPDGNYEFSFGEARVSTLVLDSAARPLIMEEKDGRAWRIEFFDYSEFNGTGRMLADKMVVLLPKGEKGVLRIKTREFKVGLWPVKALEMPLPDDARTLPLDHRKAPQVL